MAGEVTNPSTTVANGIAVTTAAPMPVRLVGGIVATAITVGTTLVANGTTTRILYDNAGVLGEYTISGSGTIVAMAAGPTFTGVPAAPTAAPGTNTTQIATTAFVTAAAGADLPLSGGTMTGGIGFSATNTLDIGTSATVLAPRTVYAGTSFVGPVGTFTTSSSLAVATGTSLALGGATIGSNALAVTGTVAFSSTLNLNANVLFSPSSDGVLRLTNNAGTNFDRLQFGGATSAFPSIQRNGATFDLVKADNSDFAAMRMLTLTAQGSGGVAISAAGGSITGGTFISAAPAGANAGVWKLGSLVTGLTLSANLTQAVYIDIGGTVYKLLTGT